MTDEELSKLIREFLPYPSKDQHYALRSFAKIVAAAEREACAALCDAEAERVRDLHDRLDDGCIDALLGKELSARSLAFSIRERGAP